ncbi:alpha/beta hydrolase [Streptomyces sp. NPDC089919]|uniref:alpha/beta fold hydrolase n=1 Tax=Streptomyces sp. NPDC089919 TaxID=3155188 RepID=UPI003426F5C7
MTTQTAETTVIAETTQATETPQAARTAETAQPTQAAAAALRTATRATLTIDGRALSYLDFGGTGRPLVALHGHLSEGASFAALAAALGPDWRVIAPDQRGHGDSDRAPEYTRAGYLADLEALLAHLGIDRAVLLGHSLGAINASHLAARRPELVEALIDVDTAADLPEGGPSPLSFVLGFPYTAPTREQLDAVCGPLAAAVGPVTPRPLADGSGWRLPFHPQDTVDSETLVHGDHWQQWLATDCPALLIHGLRSQALPAAQAQQMVTRRPRTTYVPVDTDHFVQHAAPEAFEAAVRTFLATL